MTHRLQFDHSRDALKARRHGLIAALLIVFAAGAWLLGGAETVVFLATVIAGLFMLSPRINTALVMRLHRARPLSSFEAPELHRIAAALAARADLPRVPDLYYIPSPAPNAFTTGDKENAAIAVSDGSLRLLGKREMTGVLAHEVAHVANGDTRLGLFTEIVRQMTTSTALAALAILTVGLWTVPGLEVPAWMPLFLTAGPCAAFLIQRALSRTTELAADMGAVALTGDPHALASALRKIDRATRNPWSRLLGKQRDGDLPNLLQTHPEIDERIGRLMRIQKHQREFTLPVRTPQWRPIIAPANATAPVPRHISMRPARRPLRPGVYDF